MDTNDDKIFSDILPVTKEEINMDELTKSAPEKSYHAFQESIDIEGINKAMQLQDDDVAMLSFKDFLKVNKVKLPNRTESRKSHRQNRKKKNRAASNSRKNNR